MDLIGLPLPLPACSGRLWSLAFLFGVFVFMAFFCALLFGFGLSPCTETACGVRAARGSSLQRAPRKPPDGAGQKGRELKSDAEGNEVENGLKTTRNIFPQTISAQRARLAGGMASA
jgi:hypothetical protein